MQKAFSLQQHELQQAQQLDEERKTVLAQIGALTLDMEQARAALPVVEQKRRQHLQQLVQQYGITEYRTARIEGNNLIADIIGEPEVQKPAPPSRTNGSIEATAVKE